MYPKNSSNLFNKISKNLKCDEELVSDYIYFVFSSLRKEMSEIKDINYCLPYIGRFDAKANLIVKEIERYRKKRSTTSFDASKDEQILYRALDKNKLESKRYEEAKLRKLQWHKENGDPYGKYNKELEENLKRHYELCEEKRNRRKGGQKKDETL